MALDADTRAPSVKVARSARVAYSARWEVVTTHRDEIAVRGFVTRLGAEFHAWRIRRLVRRARL